MKTFLRKNTSLFINLIITTTLFLIFINLFRESINTIRLPDPFDLMIYWGSICGSVLSIILLCLTHNFNLKYKHYIISVLIIILCFVATKIPVLDSSLISYISTLGIFSFSVYIFINLLNKTNLTKNKITEDSLLRNKTLYRLLIACIILIALILRIYKLNLLPPSVDEYFHLIAAQKDNLLGFYNYKRGSFVTEIISIIFKYTGNSVFWARIPSVIAGTVTTFLIFKIGKFFNKIIALSSAYLFAICPLCVGMARYVREYEYTFLIFSLVIYLLIKFVEESKKHKQLRAYLNIRILALFLINTLLIIYYVFFEKSGAVIEIIGTEIIVLTFSFHKNIINFYSNLSKRLKILTPLSIIPLAGLVVFYLLKNYSWAINTFQVNTDYLNMLFDPSWNPNGFIPLWYSSIKIFPQTLIILLFLYPLLKYKKQRLLLLLYTIFFFTLLPFALFSDRYFGPRYVYFSFLPFILILCSSLYYIFMDFFYGKKKIVQIVFWILVLLMFSPFNSIKGLLEEDPKVADIKTRLSHYDPNSMFDFIYQHGYQPGDFVITTRSDNFTFWTSDYKFITENNKDDYPLKRYYYDKQSLWYDYTDIGYYTYKNNTSGDGEFLFAASYIGQSCLDNVCLLNEKQRVSQLMKVQEKGWLIIDKDRNSIWNRNGYPLKDTFTAHSKIEYLGSTEGPKGYDIFIWNSIDDKQ